MTFLAVQGCGGGTNHVARHIDVAFTGLYQSSLTAVYYIITRVGQSDIALGCQYLYIADFCIVIVTILVLSFQSTVNSNITAGNGFYRGTSLGSSCTVQRNVAVGIRNIRGGGCRNGNSTSTRSIRPQRNVAIAGGNFHACFCRGDVAFDGDVAYRVSVLRIISFAVGSANLGQTVVSSQVSSQAYAAIGGFQRCGGGTNHVAVDGDITEITIIIRIAVGSLDADAVGTVDDFRCRASLGQGYIAFGSADANRTCLCICSCQTAVDGDVTSLCSGNAQGSAGLNCGGCLIGTQGNIALVRRDGHSGCTGDIAFHQNVAYIFISRTAVGSANADVFGTLNDFVCRTALGQSYIAFSCLYGNSAGISTSGNQLTCNSNVAVRQCLYSQASAGLYIRSSGSANGDVASACCNVHSCTSRYISVNVDVAFTGGNIISLVRMNGHCACSIEAVVDVDVAFRITSSRVIYIDCRNDDIFAAVDDVVCRSCSTCYTAVLVQDNLAFGGFDGNRTIICTGGLQVTIDSYIASSCGGDFQCLCSFDCTRSCLSRTNGNISVGGGNSHAVGGRHYITHNRDVAIVGIIICFRRIVALDLGQAALGRQVAGQVYMTFLTVQSCGGGPNHVARYIDVARSSLYQSSLAAVYYILVTACAVVQDDIACGGLHFNIASGGTFNRIIICRYQFAGYIDVTALGGFYRQARTGGNGYRSCSSTLRNGCRTYRNVALVSRNRGRGGGFYVAVDGDVADALNSIITAVGSGNLGQTIVCRQVARQAYAAVGGFQRCGGGTNDVAVDGDIASIIG